MLTTKSPFHKILYWRSVSSQIMTFRCFYSYVFKCLYCPQWSQYLQANVIKFKSGFTLLQLSEARNSGRGTRAGCCEAYRVPAISIYTQFTFGWLMLQKRPRILVCCFIFFQMKRRSCRICTWLRESLHEMGMQVSRYFMPNSHDILCHYFVYMLRYRTIAQSMNYNSSSLGLEVCLNISKCM